MKNKHINRYINKEYLYKKLTVMAVCLLMIISFTLGDTFIVNAKSVKNDEYVTSKSWLTPAKIHEPDTVVDIQRRGAVTDPVFDGRTAGWVTAVKDQGNYETCWSFATAAVIESNLIKNGFAGADIDISENSIAYFFYNRETDALGYTKDDYNMIARSGYNYLTAAGTLQGTGIELTTGAGIHTEGQSPYLTTPAAGTSYLGDYVVKNLYLYNYNINNLAVTVGRVKQAIMDHGAVATGMYFSETYYNEEKFSYYCPMVAANHAVTIIGWDDTYPADNFTRKPNNNGAWIVKNSYGTTFGDGGYMYISYEDKTLSELMSFEIIPRTALYNNCYQHDGTGNPSYAYNSAEWYANVFQAKGAGEFNEELKAISVYTTSIGTQYEVQVYTGLSSAGKPTGGTKAFTSNVTGVLSDAGYQMIELPEPVSLTSGEYFSVLVKLTTASGANAYVGVDTSYLNPNNDWIRFIAATGKNQSFIKVGGKWYDMAVELSANARIKAYTNITSVKSAFHLSTKNLGVSKGDSQTISLLAAPYVHRKVTWKSANSKIATVNVNGKVKGKAFGTTTVSGTFINGAKKKTLKCKVTVGPARMKGFKVSAGSKIKVKWSKNSSADGYEVRYSVTPDGNYKKLADIKGRSKTSVSKALSSGTYYVKMRPYKKSGKKKLYGSYTAAKEVVVE